MASDNNKLNLVFTLIFLSLLPYYAPALCQQKRLKNPTVYAISAVFLDHIYTGQHKSNKFGKEINSNGLKLHNADTQPITGYDRSPHLCQQLTAFAPEGGPLTHKWVSGKNVKMAGVDKTINTFQVHVGPALHQDILSFCATSASWLNCSLVLAEKRKLLH